MPGWTFIATWKRAGLAQCGISTGLPERDPEAPKLVELSLAIGAILIRMPSDYRVPSAEIP